MRSSGAVSTLSSVGSAGAVTPNNRATGPIVDVCATVKTTTRTKTTSKSFSATGNAIDNGTVARTIGTAPRAWIERAVRECNGALAFFEDGVEVLIRDEGVRNPRFRAAAGVAANAFREWRAYLKDALVLRATDDYACGVTALDLYVRRGHFLDLRVDEIAAWAEERIAAAETRLRALAADLGAAPWRDALAGLADHHPTADRYYARYEEVWRQARAAGVGWPGRPRRVVGAGSPPSRVFVLDLGPPVRDAPAPAPARAAAAPGCEGDRTRRGDRTNGSV